MSEDFRPGDVVQHPTLGRGIVQDYKHGGLIVEWADRDEYTSVGNVVFNLRRLVVIDPESDPDVIRLENALEAQGCRVGMGVQAALREFATPTPPKPDEPAGLGAVVEDADGLKWVSVEEMPPFGRWYCGVLPDDDCSIADGAFREWSALSAVRVLSEGIQP